VIQRVSPQGEVSVVADNDIRTGFSDLMDHPVDRVLLSVQS